MFITHIASCETFSFFDTEFKKQSGISQVFFPYSFILCNSFRFDFIILRHQPRTPLFSKEIEGGDRGYGGVTKLRKLRITITLLAFLRQGLIKFATNIQEKVAQYLLRIALKSFCSQYSQELCAIMLPLTIVQCFGSIDDIMS